MTKRKPPEEHKPGGRPIEWTEERLVELGDGLVAWMMEDETRLYWKEYLVVNRGLYSELISQLTGRSPAFAQLIKKAKDLQELRLLKKEGKGEIKSMFVLKNHHGYADKQEVKSEATIHQTVKDVSTLRGLSEDELKDRLRWLTETPGKH